MQAVAARYGVPVILYPRKERFLWRLANIFVRFKSSQSTPLSPPRWSTHPPYAARTTPQSPLGVGAANTVDAGAGVPVAVAED